MHVDRKLAPFRPGDEGDDRSLKRVSAFRIAIDGVTLENGLWIDPARLDKNLGTYAIKQGDLVLVQRSGEQFYILTKVVEV